MRYFVPIEGIIEGKCLTQDHFFLLALFDLIEDGVIIDNKISFNSDILKETYQNKAISFKRYNPITPFYKPFFHLNSESYYQIKWKANNKPKGAGKPPLSEIPS